MGRPRVLRPQLRRDSLGRSRPSVLMSLSPPVKRRSEFAKNVHWAFGWTFSFATFYSAYVLLVSLARRSTWFDSYEMSTWTMILGYYLAAVLAGLALAVLRPLGTTRLGAYILGVVIGFLVYGSIGVMMEGFTPLTLWIALIPSVFTGGLGVVVHDEDSAGWRGAASLSRTRKVLYGLALAIALLLLWLDVRYGLINN